MESGNQDTEHMNHATSQPRQGIHRVPLPRDSKRIHIYLSGYGTLTKTDHTPKHKADLGMHTGREQRYGWAELRISNREIT